MLDPKNLFAKDDSYHNHFLIIPNTRDGEGFLVTPDEYDKKLEKKVNRLSQRPFKNVIFSIFLQLFKSLIIFQRNQ
jgi:hypothetical protein